tara:strand:- start:268 stop:1143 length:876 start_codon:yes stop_codon:yes gene_type:complete
VSNNRLGKGLEALIRSKTEIDLKPPKKRVSSKPIVTDIAINNISPNTQQPRRNFDKIAMDELTKSIEEKGVITPITVRKVKNRYEIIAGERRWRAAKLAKKRKLPAYVITVKNEAEIMEIALIENIQRQDLNAMEESEAYSVLNSKFGLSHEKIAKAVGKKRVTISNSLRLLKLPLEIRKSLRSGSITAGHARAILQGKTTSAMNKIWRTILDKDLSVRASENLFKKTIKQQKSRNSKSKSKQLLEVENQLIQTLGTKVNIKHKKNSGSIEIFYFSEDDLDRIIDLINSIS